ncbi:hypothetical protein M569_01808 [Genlisea aurea]|uniref:Uncharacterized protein n=1 Tax=Genlisea aurea TaxID=192259 RepID=S8D6B7_9LAMI|nr:hypothetical protein M569_01808 [Genlisea aurea]
MSQEDEYRCFVGNLSWSTSDRNLKEAFEKFGHLVDAKLWIARTWGFVLSVPCQKLINVLWDWQEKMCNVVLDKYSGRSRGFGFVTYEDEKALEEAIEKMNGIDLDGRQITVDRAQANSQRGSGRDREGGDHRDRGRDRDDNTGRGEQRDSRDRDRDDAGGRDRGGRNGGGGDCYKCGKPGHFARECPSGEGSRGGSRGRDRDDRSRGGPDRGGERYGGGGRSRDSGNNRSGSGNDRNNRDRSGPYERPPQGGGSRS